MVISAEQCCAFSPVEGLSDVDTQKKVKLLESRGIDVRPCTGESVDEVLNPQDGKIHFGFFGATHCDACAPAVDELSDLLRRGGTNIGQAHYFPTETAAAGVLRQDKMKEEVGGGLNAETLAEIEKKALSDRARLEAIVKERLGDVVGTFLSCTNDRLREASGWEAESVPVFVVSGKEKAWVRSGFLTTVMMDRMAKAYEGKATYEHFVVRDLPQKVEEIKERVRKLREKETAEYKEWYPLWSALETELKFARSKHMPVRRYPPEVTRQYLPEATGGNVSVVLSIVPNAERAKDPMLVGVSVEEYNAYLDALDTTCDLVDEAIDHMEELAARERAGKEYPSPEERAKAGEDAAEYYKLKRNLPREIKEEILGKDLRPIRRR